MATVVAPSLLAPDDVAEGEHVVVAKVDLQNSSGGPITAMCWIELDDGSMTPPMLDMSSILNIPDQSTENVSLQGVADDALAVQSGDLLELVCQTTSGVLSAENARLIALKASATVVTTSSSTSTTDTTTTTSTVTSTTL